MKTTEEVFGLIDTNTLLAAVSVYEMENPTTLGFFSSVNLFREQREIGDVVAFRWKNGLINMLPYTPRKVHEHIFDEGNEKVNYLKVDSLAEMTQVDKDDLRCLENPDPVQSLAEFNSRIVERTLAIRQWSFAPSMEYMQFTALQGVVKDPHTPSKVIYDYVNEFGLSTVPYTGATVPISANNKYSYTFTGNNDIDNPTTNKQLTDIARVITAQAGLAAGSSILLLAGSSFYNGIINAPDTQNFLYQSNLRQTGLTQDLWNSTLTYKYNGITFYIKEYPQTTQPLEGGGTITLGLDPNAGLALPPGANIYKNVFCSSPEIGDYGRGKDLYIQKKVSEWNYSIHLLLASYFLPVITTPQALMNITYVAP
jgi:hypothetical protein